MSERAFRATTSSWSGPTRSTPDRRPLTSGMPYHSDTARTIDVGLSWYARNEDLTSLTPAQLIWKEWQSDPEFFYEEPCHLMAGLNT